MTKSILALGFKWCKSNADVYYINEKTKRLVIVIIYIDNIYFIRFSTPLRVSVKIHDEMEIL